MVIQRYLLLLGGVLAVGSAALLARLGLDGGMSALQLALWRLTIASSVLLVWQAVQTFRQPSESVLPRAEQTRLAVAGVCLAFHFVTWFASLTYVSIARSTLLVTTSPLWAGLLGLWIPALRVGRGFWIGLLVAAPGIVLVTTQGMPQSQMSLPANGAAWQGDVLAMAGGLLIVPYLLLVQRAQATFGTLRTVTWTYSSAAVCLWLITLVQGNLRLPPTNRVWLAVLGMALVPQLLGHTALNRSLRHFSPSQVSTATLLEPVFAGVLAWLFLRESVTLGQMAGAALLLFGVACALRAKRQPLFSTDTEDV